MNKIEKLIDELCPDGVENSNLGNFIQLKKGKQLNKELLNENGKYPAFNGGVSYSGFTDTYNYEENTIIISQGGASAGFVNFVETKFYANAHCYVILPDFKKINNRFVYHFLKLNQENLTGKQHGAGIPALRTGEILNIKIPVPPLAIQEKIVEILDKFTQLETELETELEARKAQYQFYRNQLLAFENKEVEWKTLGDLAKIGDGLHGTPKYSINGDYHFINGNNLDNGSLKFNENTKRVDENMYKKHGIDLIENETIFLSINGTIGSVAIYKDEKIVLGKSVAYFNINDKNLNYKFLFYYLQCDYSKNYYETQKTGSTIKNLGLKALRAFPIPVPPLSEQERIVKILDQFDDLVNNISIGLPAEIKARRQQYEFYREKLLTFKEVQTIN